MTLSSEDESESKGCFLSKNMANLDAAHSSTCVVARYHRSTTIMVWGPINPLTAVTDSPRSELYHSYKGYGVSSHGTRRVELCRPVLAK